MTLIRDFETGDLSGLRVSGTPPLASARLARSGEWAMRVYNHRHESSTPGRTEVVILKDGGGRLEMPYTASFWVGFSVFVPDNWVPDKEGLRETIFQLHSLPYYKDGGPKQPPFALGFREDKWDITSRAASTMQWNPDLVLGLWHDWVINFQLSSTNGLLQVFHSSGGPYSLVAERAGNMKQTGGESVYFKFGLYKWSWKEEHGNDYPSNMDDRLYYHDEIRIGASFDEVAPPSGSPPPLPDPVPDPVPDPIPDPIPLLQTQVAVLQSEVAVLKSKVSNLEDWGRAHPVLATEQKEEATSDG
jgi:hypothetical protein